jgi:alginate O-acetyltransferase complex protein AlgI
MVFSSPLFLFIFLPLTLLGGLLLRKTAGNIFLLLASLFFYAWGEGSMVILLLGSVGLNYLGGLGIHQWRNRSQGILILVVLINLLILVYFKYLNALLGDSLISFSFLHRTSQGFPMGISFFTFQGIAYLIDVYRSENPPQRNLLHYALFISFFPQIMSGPINRYSDTGEAFRSRKVTLEGVNEGIIRFIRGLAKKVILANTLGIFADIAFSASDKDLGTAGAWLGIVCYTLQIYFDFSGYTDMALGLAGIFGIRFRENFNYPYISKSIQEFWQRWHISLSSWLRDYLFSPISVRLRNQGGYGQLIAVMITFVICGIWHGPGMQFLIWAMIHVILLIAERIKILRIKKLPDFFKHVYVLLGIMVAWVFFRADSPQHAMLFLKRMFIPVQSGSNDWLMYVNGYTVFVFLLALIFCLPLRKVLSARLTRWFKIGSMNFYLLARYPVYLFLFLISLAEMAQSAYNPFIYFKF